MGCSVDCAKCLVIVFSIVYAIVGVASISIGVYYFTQESKVLKSLDDETQTLVRSVDDAAAALTWGAFLFTVTGALELVFALAGIFAAWKENNCLVKMYATLLIFMFTVHVVLSGLSFSQASSESTLNNTKEKISNNFHNYTALANAKTIQKYLENQYRCCGLDTYKDYDLILRLTSVPQSCCADRTRNCGTANAKYSMIGCSSAVASKIIFHYKTVGVISTIVAILEIFGGILTFYFINTIKNKLRRGTYT